MARSSVQAAVFANEDRTMNEALTHPANTMPDSQIITVLDWADGGSYRASRTGTVEIASSAATLEQSSDASRGTDFYLGAIANPFLRISIPSPSLSFPAQYFSSASQDIEKGVLHIIKSIPKRDLNMVDWDGPNDPANPYNWTARRKWVTVSLVAAQTFISPLASSMFAPGVPQVLQEFHSDNAILGAFVVSIYVLGYAFGPLFIAPLSELYGRSPIYHATNLLFIVFTIACAVASNFNMLIGFRFLEGVAGSAALTIGGGTVADLFAPEERGAALAVWQMGPMLGPIVGPTAGGFLSQAKGWRWIFWVIAITGGVVSIGHLLFLRETYSVTLLETKTIRLRQQTGNRALRSRMDNGLSPKALFKLSIVRPLKLLFCSPIVFSMCLFAAVVYGYMYLFFTTITEVFEQKYGFSQGTAGLAYLGIGTGMLIGLITFGKGSDVLLRRKAAINGQHKPEYRLPPMIPGSVLIPIGLFIYGWTADKHIFWFVPLFGTSLMGIGIILIFSCVSSYLVDAFTLYAASAIAANTVSRSIFAGLLPLAGQPMFQALGLGWGNSVLGFIALMLIPIPILLYKYGESLRTAPKYQLNL